MCLSQLKENRKCIVCEGKIFGKLGKIYCDLKCKNFYNNYKRAVLHKMHHDTNNIIFKNYLILAGFMQAENKEIVCKQIDLERLGFQFEKLTGVCKNKNTFRFHVYEYSFYRFGNNQIKITRGDSSNKLPSIVFLRGKKEMELKMISAVAHQAH